MVQKQLWVLTLIHSEAASPHEFKLRTLLGRCVWEPESLHSREYVGPLGP